MHGHWKISRRTMLRGAGATAGFLTGATIKNRRLGRLGIKAERFHTSTGTLSELG